MKKHLLIIPCLILIISACSKKHETPQPPADNIKKITLEKDTLQVLAGDTRKVNITIDPSNYNRALLKWASSDTTVLSVDTGGTITAKKTGISTIKVFNKTNTVSASCMVTVLPPPVIDSLKIGLIAWYKFENNTIDSSGHGNNGILSNDVSFVTGKSGRPNSACYFNGTSSFIRVKDSPELRLNNTSFTLSFWLKLADENPGFESDVVSKRTGERNKGWCAGVTGAIYTNSATNELPEPDPQEADGLLSFGRGSDDGNYTRASYVASGDWIFCTIIYQADTQQIKFFANSFPGYIFPGVPSPGNDITADMYIGKNNPEIAAAYFIKGAVDDLRIYNRALSKTELGKLYQLAP